MKDLIERALDLARTVPAPGFRPSFYWSELHLPSDQVTALLTSDARLEITLDGELYGPLRIYRFDAEELACHTTSGTPR